MVPNHVFQLLSLTAMEPPNSFDADAVRSAFAALAKQIGDVRLDVGTILRIRFDSPVYLDGGSSSRR